MVSETSCESVLQTIKCNAYYEHFMLIVILGNNLPIGKMTFKEHFESSHSTLLPKLRHTPYNHRLPEKVMSIKMRDPRSIADCWDSGTQEPESESWIQLSLNWMRELTMGTYCFLRPRKQGPTPVRRLDVDVHKWWCHLSEEGCPL